MAVSEIQFKALVRRVERLETGLHHLKITVEQKEPSVPEVVAGELSEKERGLAALRRAGLLVDPSPATWTSQVVPGYSRSSPIRRTLRS